MHQIKAYLLVDDFRFTPADERRGCSSSALADCLPADITELRSDNRCRLRRRPPAEFSRTFAFRSKYRSEDNWLILQTLDSLSLTELMWWMSFLHLSADVRMAFDALSGLTTEPECLALPTEKFSMTGRSLTSSVCSSNMSDLLRFAGCHVATCNWTEVLASAWPGRSVSSTSSPSAETNFSFCLTDPHFSIVTPRQAGFPRKTFRDCRSCFLQVRCPYSCQPGLGVQY